MKITPNDMTSLPRIMIATAAIAFAQIGVTPSEGWSGGLTDVNQETDGKQNINLFDGTTFSINDLIQMTQFLDQQPAASPKDQGKQLDDAIEQFKGNRNSSLQIGPDSLQPSAEAEEEDPLDPDPIESGL
jgi:hypothetical protein